MAANELTCPICGMIEKEANLAETEGRHVCPPCGRVIFIPFYPFLDRLVIFVNTTFEEAQAQCTLYREREAIK